MPNILSTEILFISDNNPSRCHHFHFTDEETEVQRDLVIHEFTSLVSSEWWGEIYIQVSPFFKSMLFTSVYLTPNSQNSSLRQENKNKQLKRTPKTWVLNHAIKITKTQLVHNWLSPSWKPVTTTLLLPDT